MTKRRVRRIALPCSCGSIGHVVVAEGDEPTPWNKEHPPDPIDSCIVLGIQMDYSPTMWQRLKTAIAFVLRRPGSWCSVSLLERDDAISLLEFIDGYYTDWDDLKREDVE